MTIQLVETSDEDSFIAVAQHVANLVNDGQIKTALADTPGSRFLEDCTNLIQEQRFEEYVSRIIAQLDLVYSKSSEKDAECTANILVHAVARLPEDRQAAVALDVAKALTKGDERAEERLVALINLYNISTSKAAQLPVLMIAAEYAKKTPRCTAMMVSAVRGKADKWVQDWKLTEPQAMELYLALGALSRTANDRAAVKEYLKLMTSALSLAKAQDAAALATMRPHAVSAICDFIRSPSIFQCDLMELPAVAQLAADPKGQALHRLITVILAGDIAGFKSIATPTLLEQVGVTPEAALSKARMVALLALGTKAKHDEVPLSVIQTTLDVPAEQVEMWIVKAIGAKLLEGKIDQVRGVLSVTRCAHPSFGSQQWGEIKAQLEAWKECLGNVASAMAGVKPPPHVSARGATVKA